jgi:riboflavin kinase/FMN adenylyltransferase
MTETSTFSRAAGPLGPAVIAIGAFDGVHVGHQALVRDSMAIARSAGVASIVMTFEPDPEDVLFPETAPPRLTLAAEKTALLAALGPDRVLVVAFDEVLAALSPEAFCTRVLCAAATPHTVVVGSDFRFGSHASGDVRTLQDLGAVHGFTVLGHDLIARDGMTVTATRIRALIADGAVARAAHLLGRPHRVVGVVGHGRGVGGTLGVPTANLVHDPTVALPAHGVYSAWAHLGSERFPAAVSVGVPASFPDAPPALEAHLIGFDGELYGATVAIDFVDRVRDQRPFASLEALSAAIADDVAHIARTLAADQSGDV